MSTRDTVIVSKLVNLEVQTTYKKKLFALQYASNTLKYCYNFVFPFHCFLVITVAKYGSILFFHLFYNTSQSYNFSISEKLEFP